MNKILKIAFIASVIYGNYTFATDNVIATYTNDNKKLVEVRASEVQNELKEFFDSTPEFKNKQLTQLSAEMQDGLVRFYINAQLMNEQTKKLGIKNTKDFKEKLEKVSNQLATMELYSSISKKQVTQNLVEESYKKLAAELKDQEEYKLKHILVRTEQEAKDLEKQIKNGAKFEELAKKYSEDKGSNAQGGEMGYLRKGQLDGDFEKVAFKLQKNQVSAPVKTQFGFHIIKLEDKRKIKLPSKEEGLKMVKAQLEKEAIAKYLEDVNTKAGVKVFLEKNSDIPNIDMNSLDSK